MSNWLTYSRRLTHTSGHPSAVDRAQDGKFVGQRPTFYHCATQPTQAILLCTHWYTQNQQWWALSSM